MNRLPHRLKNLFAILLIAGMSPLAAHAADPVISNGGTAINNFVSSSAAVGGPFGGLDINHLVGADRFYAAGYTGTSSVIANIEGGFVWNGHETLGAATVQFRAPGHAGTQLGEYDWHATLVGEALAGRDNGGGSYQRGIAYGASLWSGAIATQWNGTGFTTSWGWADGNAFTYPYVQALVNGVNGRTADVVNCSWGYGGNTYGDDVFSDTIDGLARQSRRTVVFSAGNNGPGSDTVLSPANGYNSIVVGALGSDTDAAPYRTISGFSSRGPADYRDPANGAVSGVRARVDITAPGQNLTLAEYGGTTGGNKSGSDPTSGATNYYSFNSKGTSFAAPIVSGGASLLCDAGYARFGGGNSIDARVIKAVLLNSADKPVGWNNGQTTANGVTETKQGLDYTYGAGILNLSKAFDQYTGGTTDVPGTGHGNLGFVKPTGWDFGTVLKGGVNDYFIAGSLLADTTFTATLNWMANRQYVATAAGGSITASNLEFTDLDLELWSVTGGIPTSLIARSDSLYNNTEHFSFALPATGDYMIQVVWSGARFDTVNTTSEDYAIAWSGTAATIAPESDTLILFLVCTTITAAGSALRFGSTQTKKT